MVSESELAELPAAARKVLLPDAPPAVKMLAARGAIPGLKPGDIVTLVALLADAEDANVAETARATFAKLPAPILTGALGADLSGRVIERLAADAYGEKHEVVEALLRMPRITTAALEHLAQVADERCGELIATNEQLMLKHPTVIEKLYMNKRVRMSTADRLIELAVRNGLTLSIPAFAEAAQAIRNELIAEAQEEPTFDDVVFKETGVIAERIVLDEQDPDTHEVDDEGEEHVKQKFLPLHAQIAMLTPSQKIRRATLGTAAERLLLVRDPNRIVAAAAVKSPLMRENEAIKISSSRSVSEDVLRHIALNREFTRNYMVKVNLISNPRTPFSFATRFIPYLRDNDLRSLSKSKNVSGSVSQAARSQLGRKENSG